MKDYSDRKHFTNTIKWLLKITQVAIDYPLNTEYRSLPDDGDELNMYSALRYIFNGNKHIDVYNIGMISYRSAGSNRMMLLDSVVFKLGTIEACQTVVPFLYYNFNNIFIKETYDDTLINYIIDYMHDLNPVNRDSYLDIDVIALELKDKLLEIYNILDNKKDLILADNTSDLF